MDNEKPPITISEWMQLTTNAVDKQYITWLRVTMTSDAYMCIRLGGKIMGNKNNRKKVLVLDLREEQPDLTYRTLTGDVDYAVISPPKVSPDSSSEVLRILVKRFNRLQVLQESGGRWCPLAKYDMEDVQFLSWLNSSVIGIVTDLNVYHWDIDSDEGPQKVFSRHQRLWYSEIVSYKADPSMQWFALTGLIPQEDCIAGVTQLYSMENLLTQCISAHAVTFTKYRFEGNRHPSTALCVAARDSGRQAMGKVHVVELGPYIPGNLALCSHYDNIHFPEEGDKFDFPVSLQVSANYGLLYVVTKYGRLHVCEMDSGSCLFSTLISTEVIFTTALQNATQGILCINTAGQVLSVELKTERLVQYVREVAKKSSQATRLDKLLVKHFSLSGQSLI